MNFYPSWSPVSTDSLVVQTTNVKSLTDRVHRREVIDLIHRDGIDIWSMEETHFDEPLAAAFKAHIERSGLGTAFSATWTHEATMEWWNTADRLSGPKENTPKKFRPQKGVTIFVSERIKHYVVAVDRFIPEGDPLHQADTGTGLCVRLQMHGKEVDVLGLYIPGTNWVPERQLQESLLAWTNLRIDAANAANRLIIVLGDFNQVTTYTGPSAQEFTFKVFRGAKSANDYWDTIPGRTFQDAFWWVHGTHDESNNRIDGTYPLTDQKRVDKLYNKLDFAMVSTQLAPHIVQCAKTTEPSMIHEDHSSLRFELAGVLDAQLIELPPVTEHADVNSWECTPFPAPYVCKLCKYTSYKKENFDNHAGVHTKAMTFKCSHCDKKFVTAGGLRTHECMRTGDRPHKCGSCNMDFRRFAHLKQHVQRHNHTAVQQLHCKKCWVRFDDFSDMCTHFRQHKSTWTTNSALRCICGLYFKKQKYLEQHCPFCAWYEHGREPSKTDPTDAEIGQRIRELTKAFRMVRSTFESK
ncbi:hypothetical protein IWW50_001265 [Coemansia erecta]|nr:hypothetical protein GGF43_000924 [Coemansia sp. RSA 2618]KAJ2828660.1 hypothetical protein IWW50_001265 [Coemansia erecta]